jgi:GTP-binding protein LepA
VPPPAATRRAARALIFDSEFDQYRGVIAYVRVVDGTFTRARRSARWSAGTEARSTTSASSRRR